MSTVFVLTAFNLADEPLGEPGRRLTGLPVRVGRNALNDFVVNHAAVSSFHARVEDIDGKLCVIDLGSKNGVRVQAQGHIPQLIKPHEPVDLREAGFQFFLGSHVRIQIAFDRLRDPLEYRGSVSFSGDVLGNAGRLLEPSPSMIPEPPQPVAGFAPGGVPAPAQGMPGVHGVPGMPAMQPMPGVPGAAGMPAMQPMPGAAGAAGAPAVAYAPPPPQLGGGYQPVPAPVQAPGSGPRPHASTAFLGQLSIETMALLGLRELAASLVPGVPLESTGDIARFITKLHDALDAFCRSFIPLRDGYSQFVSSLDLQRASIRRTNQRSSAYRAVEAAHTPEAVAQALLNPKDRSFDAPQAIEGIFADLMLHQMALLEGVMRGVRALLEELSPENIERNAGQHLPLGRYKALWNTYCQLFENLYEERQTFAYIFGPEFTAAYRQYRAGRNDDNPA